MEIDPEDAAHCFLKCKQVNKVFQELKLSDLRQTLWIPSAQRKLGSAEEKNLFGIALLHVTNKMQVNPQRIQMLLLFC